MDEAKALAAVERSLKRRRYEHTLRVTEEAEILARRFQVDISKARLAAILHDYAKYRPIEEMKETVQAEGLSPLLLHYGDEILHSFVGSHYVATELGITDLEILSAISYHTTGRANMTKLEKVVFLADYIEPGRKFPGVDEVRETAKMDLEKACLLALRNTIMFLVSKLQPVYPETLEAYNELIFEIKRRS